MLRARVVTKVARIEAFYSSYDAEPSIKTHEEIVSDVEVDYESFLALLTDIYETFAEFHTETRELYIHKDRGYGFKLKDDLYDGRNGFYKTSNMGEVILYGLTSEKAAVEVIAKIRCHD